LAGHCLEAGILDQALPYALLAGDQAETVYAHAEADRAYRLAIDLARESGDQAPEGEALEKRRNTVLLTERSPEAADLLAPAGERDAARWNPARSERRISRATGAAGGEATRLVVSTAR
jgi:hypothetical protein